MSRHARMREYARFRCLRCFDMLYATSRHFAFSRYCLMLRRHAPFRRQMPLLLSSLLAYYAVIYADFFFAFAFCCIRHYAMPPIRHIAPIIFGDAAFSRRRLRRYAPLTPPLHAMSFRAAVSPIDLRHDADDLPLLSFIFFAAAAYAIAAYSA